MNYLIRITIEFLIYLIFFGITYLISYPIPKLKSILEEYEKNKSHWSCFVISSIGSMALSATIVGIIRIRSGSFIEPQDGIPIFILLVAFGYGVLRYSNQKS